MRCYEADRMLRFRLNFRLQSRCDFDTVGLQVPTSVSVMCIWEIPVKCGTKELNIERRLMIF